MRTLDIIYVRGFANFLCSTIFQIDGSVTGAAHPVERGFCFDVVGQGLPDEDREDDRMDDDRADERLRRALGFGFLDKHSRKAEFNPISENRSNC